MTTVNNCEHEIDYCFGNSFLQPQIQFAKFYEVETTHGTECVQYEFIGNDGENETEMLENLYNFCEGKPLSYNIIEGYGARLSANGYLDSTPWTVFDDLIDAKNYLVETYGDDNDNDNDT